LRPISIGLSDRPTDVETTNDTDTSKYPATDSLLDDTTRCNYSNVNAAAGSEIATKASGLKCDNFQTRVTDFEATQNLLQSVQKVQSHANGPRPRPIKMGKVVRARPSVVHPQKRKDSRMKSDVDLSLRFRSS
jgi:hypothetical protein